MARKTYARPWQPRNKPHGVGIRKCEGPSADVRVSMGAYMAAAIQLYADVEGISIAGYIRDAMRSHLSFLGTTFD